MKTKTLFAAGVALIGVSLSGCLNSVLPASPAQSHGLALEAKSSACVQVFGPRLQMNHGNLEIAGSVKKGFNAGTTAFSHLDILFCDSSGNAIKTTPIRFTPQSVGYSRFAPRFGYYALTLEPLPENASRIIVRGHDGYIAGPHS